MVEATKQDTLEHTLHWLEQKNIVFGTREGDSFKAMTPREVVEVVYGD